MAQELPVVTDDSEIALQLSKIRETDARSQPVLCELGGGLLRFAEVVFPDVPSGDIYAQHYVREPKGRGAHFDVYGRYLDSTYPWIGHYNLDGSVSLRTVELPKELAEHYFRTHPVADEAAYDARRSYAAIALGAPEAEVFFANLNLGMGMILPQPRETDGAHIVHEIVPLNRRDPGEFVKLVMPKPNEAALERIKQDGYMTLDALVLKALSRKLRTDDDEDDSDDKMPLGLSDESDDLRSLFTERMPHRRCSGLD